MAAKTTMENYDPTNLPPGFRFHPTDDELVGHYLVKKASDPMRFMVHAITDIDLNKCEPWDLPHKAKMGEKEWYFFSQRDRKYPTGMRTNRATEKGYWKATGKDRDVVRNREGGHSGQMVVGMKKTLVFYKGRAPRGVKTHWIMHEYRLDKEGVNMVTQAVATLRLPGSGKDEWVVCRIFEKQSGNKKNLGMLDVHMGPYHTGYGDPSSPLHDHPDMDDDGETSLSPYGTNRVTNFNDLLSPASIPVGNPLSVLGEMNGRVFSSYSASSFPGVNASQSPPTGPLSSDLSSTLHSPNYADLSPHVSNILNVVTNSGPNYSIANANYAMTQLLSQPMMQQGVHMGGLRSCKVEYPFEPMVPCTSSGEDEAHSGQTTSPGPLMDISPNHHGWIANIGDDLQFQPGLQQQRGHITADQLNQASYLPAAESSCVTEENQNSLYRINGFRYMETSTSGRVPGWAC